MERGWGKNWERIWRRREEGGERRGDIGPYWKKGRGHCGNNGNLREIQGRLERIGQGEGEGLLGTSSLVGLLLIPILSLSPSSPPPMKRQHISPPPTISSLPTPPTGQRAEEIEKKVEEGKGTRRNKRIEGSSVEIMRIREDLGKELEERIGGRIGPTRNWEKGQKKSQLGEG